MPYVQRNRKGEITGIHANAQPDTAEEKLSDDNPEVVAFRARFPPGFLTQPSPKEWRRMERMREQAEKDHDTIRRLITAFALRFSELELALSALLYVILNTPKTQVAYAIYYRAPRKMTRLA